MKVQVSLDDALMKRIDDYADENYMSRSGFITLATTQFLNSADVTKAIKDIAVCFRKIADTGEVDEQAREQLEDLERLSKFLVAAGK